MAGVASDDEAGSDVASAEAVFFQSSGCTFDWFDFPAPIMRPNRLRARDLPGVLDTTAGFLLLPFIGTVQKGMGIGAAAETFTLLTIGDGLVSQIPALIISTAAGIVVTRSSSDKNMGEQMAGQLLIKPRSLFIVAGIKF